MPKRGKKCLGWAVAPGISSPTLCIAHWKSAPAPWRGHGPALPAADS